MKKRLWMDRVYWVFPFLMVAGAAWSGLTLRAVAQGARTTVSSPTLLEQNIAVRCKVLFEQERVHTLYLFSEAQARDLMTPETLAKVYKGKFRTVVVWGWWMKTYVKGKGTVPDEQGRFEPNDPAELRKLIDYIHAAGMDAAIHIHPGAWRDAGFTGAQLVDELERQRKMWGWRAVHFDGADLGNSMDEAVWVMDCLHALGWWVNLHDTINPFQDTKTGKHWRKSSPWEQAEAGRVDWLSPVSLRANGSLRGETTYGPESLQDIRRYLRQRSGVLTRPATLTTEYPSEWSLLRGRPDLYYYLLTEVGMAQYANPGPALEAFFTYYWPTYATARLEYEKNPRAYIEAMAQRWQRR
jgi:hypothetical protein